MRVVIFWVAAVAVLSALLGAATPAKGQTTPSAPSDLTFLGGVLRWKDTASEDGFRVTVTITGNAEFTREFNVAKNVTEFALSAELLPSCPDRYGANYTVQAVYGTALSDAAMTGVALQCPLTPPGGPEQASGLPYTGGGAVHRAVSEFVLSYWVLAVLGAGFASIGLVLRGAPRRG